MTSPPRFFGPLPREGATVRLGAEETYHARAVLRLGPGDAIEIFDGSGRLVHATIVSLEGREFQATIDRELSSSSPLPELTLGIGMAKGKHFDLAIRSCSELGVAKLWPLSTERTVVKLKESRKTKLERWQRLALESSKQAKRSHVTEVESPRTLTEALEASGSFDRILIAHLGEGTRPLHAVLEEFPGHDATLGLIGPEGDFSAEEVRACLEHGAIPVSLTPSTLRVETAAAYLASVLVYDALARPPQDAGNRGVPPSRDAH